MKIDMKICKLDGCNAKSRALGYCQKHYKKFLQSGKKEDNINVDLRYKHHLCYCDIYNILTSMRARCNNKNDKSYKRYGGRGIKVCGEWDKDPKAFSDWAIANGYKKGLSIDRIDNNSNYEPSNCRWVNMVVQSNNRTNSKFITIKNETLTLAQWCKKLNLNYSMVYYRLSIGISPQEALFTPSKKSLFNKDNKDK